MKEKGNLLLDPGSIQAKIEKLVEQQLIDQSTTNEVAHGTVPSVQQNPLQLSA